MAVSAIADGRTAERKETDEAREWRRWRRFQQQAHKSSRRTTVHAANDSSAGAHCRVGEGGEIVRT